jgi:serine/threonine protein kinase
MTKMKGGLLLNDTHKSKTIEDAIDFFKTNSTFSILTNSSSACITFQATLNEEFWDDSPFIHIRSGIIEQPVRTLLFKYFPVNPSRNAESDLVSFYTCNPRGGGKTFIELSQKAEIKREYDIQLLLYETTYNTMSSAYEPVCPYPIHCSTDLDKEYTIQEIIKQLDKSNKEKIEKDIFIITDTLCGDLNELIEEESEDESHFTIYDKTTKKEVTRNPNHPILGEEIIGAEARAKIETLGCIVMEFMDGFITLNEYLKTTTNKNDINKSKSLAAYEVVRLKQIGLIDEQKGFIHGDLFLDNIMYNPEYNYISNKVDKDNYKGRALLIDFGQSSIDFKALEEEEKAFYLKYDEHTDVYERKEKYLRFYPPYTFEEIYTRRLDASLTFRETRILELREILKKYKTLSTKKEQTKFVNAEKIQLKLDIITNSEKKLDHEAFNDSFDVIIIPILKSRDPRIQELKESEIKIEGKISDMDILTKRKPELGEGIHSHKKQNAFSNRRTRTTLRIKRRKQTKRKKRTKRKKINN